ncbi:YqeG family HAD IIIA-type phosphatase [Oscillospiraceae bacterium PP1C4]
MSVFHPDFYFKRVFNITPAWLRAQKISVLLLDVDNTLTTHDNPEVEAAVCDWIAKMNAAGIKLLIISNNKPERVKPFSDKLGLGCIAHARKPLSGGVKRAMKRLGVTKGGIAIVGDQIFTDVLCANLAGVTSILVEPIELESFPFFKMKRRMEKIILKNYSKGEDRWQ